jgi:hypothetical protein
MSKNLAKALLKLQSQITPVHKDSVNPHFKSNFSSLMAVTEHLKDYLTDCGLFVTQRVVVYKDKHYLETKLIHAESGEFIKDHTPILPVDNKPQSFGSALSYAKRYAKLTITGLTDTLEDDDAEKAMGRDTKTTTHALQNKISTVSKPQVDKTPAAQPKTPRSVPVNEIVKLVGLVKTKGRTEAWLTQTIKKEFNVLKLTDLSSEQIEKLKEYL